MELQNVKIAGSGTISGGEYNVVSIAGSGSSTADISCKLLKVAGTASFKGCVDAEEISIAGSSKFHQNLKSKKIKIAGTAKVEGNIESEELNIDGNINILGECNVGTLKQEGAGSKFNNIYGEYIKIESKRSKKIEVNEIEATEIELRKVDAKRISGDKITVYGNSKIDVIEFRTSLKISKNVEVKEIIKL